jgi:hypothetical protein
VREDEADQHDRTDDAQAAQLRAERVDVAVQRVPHGLPQWPDGEHRDDREPHQGDGDEQAAHPANGNGAVCSGSGLPVMSDRLLAAAKARYVAIAVPSPKPSGSGVLMLSVPTLRRPRRFSR